MILQASGLSKSFGATTVFENINFEVKNTEKIALVGKNGCGKTTLMKILSGELDSDLGTVYKQKDLKLGYLAQVTFLCEDNLVKDELFSVFADLIKMKEQLEQLGIAMIDDHSEQTLTRYADLEHDFSLKGGYTFEIDIETIFTKFGFNKEDLYKPLNTFSGGQKTRIAFAKLLLSKPDILFLDEPTNHLDLETIKWLEKYLSHYPKAVILVSHDRYFLDQITEVVYEIENEKANKYIGNYSSYLKQKESNQEKMLSAYNRQQKDIERLEQLIQKFRYKKSKASFAQSKIKYLEKMDKIEYQKADNKIMKAHFEIARESGKKVLEVEDLAIGYDTVLSKDLNFTIYKKDRIAILGKNGEGKSTLIKTLMNLIEQKSGSFLYGHNVDVGYFDQQNAQLDSNKLVIDELWDENVDLDQTTIRTILGTYLFSADDVFKQVNVLSGGEKVRLSLAKLMLKKANFLILDEPTNHLDIPSKESLEAALENYEGTLLFVSHDRYFIQKIANKILFMDNNKATLYPFGYEQYIEEVENKVENIVVEKSKATYIKNKDPKKELKKIEEKIDQIEKRLAEIEKLQFEPEVYHDYLKMNELDREKEKLEANLEDLLNTWEQLQI